MAQSFTFTVHVHGALLIQPKTTTPYEFKYLSNIDDQLGLRNHIPFIHFFSHNPSLSSQDPVITIREALGRALVYYYPLAGRLRNGVRGFVEAEANVSLREITAACGETLKPPFPCLDKLLVDDVWGPSCITDSPLLRVQVTRLRCGGFVLAYTFNHCMCDAFGALQFMTTASLFARNPNLPSLSNSPTWAREALTPRDPPRITLPHPEYHDPNEGLTNPPLFSEAHFKHLVQNSYFFSKADLSTLKRKAHNAPTFDAVASCLWRARTKALGLEGDLRLLFPIAPRLRCRPPLPNGYYGTAVVFVCARVDANALCRPEGLANAARLISGAKREVDDEYRASVIDLLELRGRREFGREGVFVVSDQSRLAFAGVDFGWGRAVYAGAARAGTGPVPGMVTSIVGHNGGVVALVSLEREQVGAFEEAVREDLRPDAKL
ncbi:hypothetical protein AMTRI_Chr04g242600 [Amborella trichopoda]